MTDGTTCVSHFDWKNWLAKQGFNAVLLAAFIWFLGSQIVIPMRDDQQRFLNSVMETNRTHSEVALKQTLIQQQTSAALENMSTVLEQIRDDQRSGVWRDANSKAKGP